MFGTNYPVSGSIIQLLKQLLNRTSLMTEAAKTVQEKKRLPREGKVLPEALRSWQDPGAWRDEVGNLFFRVNINSKNMWKKQV